jgi:hypothetical protein
VNPSSIFPILFQKPRQLALIDSLFPFNSARISGPFRLQTSGGAIQISFSSAVDVCPRPGMLSGQVPLAFRNCTFFPVPRTDEDPKASSFLSWSMVASKEVGRCGFVLGLDLTHVPFGNRITTSATIPTAAALRDMRKHPSGSHTSATNAETRRQRTGRDGALLQKNFYFLQQDVFLWEPPAHLHHSFDVLLSDMVSICSSCLFSLVFVLDLMHCTWLHR